MMLRLHGWLNRCLLAVRFRLAPALRRRPQYRCVGDARSRSRGTFTFHATQEDAKENVKNVSERPGAKKLGKKSCKKGGKKSVPALGQAKT